MNSLWFGALIGFAFGFTIGALLVSIAWDREYKKTSKYIELLKGNEK